MESKTPPISAQRDFTLDALRAAAQLLPAGAVLSIPRDALLAALKSSSLPRKDAVAAASEQSDRWIAAREVADALHVSPRYVYAHVPQFPFAKRLPGGTIRFSERGLRQWMQRAS